ncbi:hypothetical protein CALVIDRAFT_534535 [Calocera viscosa TUFC12733]|uniref:Letm1 RBD domain-containing protein n=1 Tax=Calocera viscosa (strain TUFC12733) TaxID=1330018 RepID=A0A167PP16_CALVF|nr:hypothetical protein CALVIDRAFT_534535 [Calocera viscosa TUFC12733]
MFATLVVQRHAAHLYRAKSPIIKPINELSLRAFHGRPSSYSVAVIVRGGRLYATVPDAAARQTSKPAGIPLPEGKKKAKVELRPSPKLPETPSIAALSSVSNAPPPPSATTSTATAASKAADLKPLPATPSTAETPQSKGLRSSIDQAIADVLKASREGQIAAIDPNLPWALRMLKWGLELGKFYFRGLKRVLEHRKIVGEIGRRCQEEGRERTWREERFVQLYRSDRLKLVPFIITLLLLEEAIPLIVIWAPFMLPSTCILTSQQERMEANRLAKHRAGLTSLGAALSVDRMEGRNVALATSIPELEPDLVKALCGTLSLRTYLPTPFLRQRLSSRLSHITADDALLRPALPSLDVHELQQAVTERGGLAAGVAEEDLRMWLSRWLKRAATKTEAEMVDPAKQRVGLLLDYAWKQWESRA